MIDSFLACYTGHKIAARVGMMAMIARVNMQMRSTVDVMALPSFYKGIQTATIERIASGCCCIRGNMNAF